MKIEGCKGCTERTPVCHFDCEKYREYTEANEQRKNKEKEQTRLHIYQIDQKNRSIRNKRLHISHKLKHEGGGNNAWRQIESE